MSIVERALQKAQSKARAEPSLQPPQPGPDPVVPETAVAPAQPSPPAFEAGDQKDVVRIDIERLRAEGRLPSADRALQAEEEVRRVKWPLLKAIEGRDGVAPARNNVVLVTSALAGEGKTFMSLNLALSIVRDREMRVVLVDGDVAKPGLTPSLGLVGKPGLNDALEDTSLDVSAVTYRTDVDGLYFVPAGTWNPHAPEFFAGSRMPQLIEALSRRIGRGVVIFDSPPLLATNEAQVATRFAGQVLVVVRADQTEQQAVLDAIALVDKEAPVSAVLNRCTPSPLSRYYGQYYYGYDYGARDGQPHRGPRRAHREKGSA